MGNPTGMTIILYIITSAIALSGWATVYYNYVTSVPKISGQVFQVMVGQMKHPTVADKELTSFTTYLYLINTRKSALHILDYEMEALVGGRWQRLERVYGIHAIKDLNFFSPEGRKIEIKNFSDNLIYRKNLPVEFGKPLHGWIVFAGDASLHGKTIPEYRLTCIDAFRNKHVIISKREQFANIFLLQDLADIAIPADAITK